MADGLGRGGYRAVDPLAYGGQPPIALADVVAEVVGVQVVLLLVLAVLFHPVVLLVVTGLSIANLWRAPWPWRRRREAPFVVDRPGVYVVGAGGEGRLVHWESIDSIVLCDVTSRRSAHRHLEPGVGLRLRGHADVVAIRLPLDGWVVDERRLLSAVARFAPPGVSLVREGPFGEIFTLREAAEDVARRAAEGAARYAAERLRSRSAAPGPQPADRAGSGERPFAVGPEGVYLGPVPGRGGGRPGRLVPWADVAAVVVFDAQRGTYWHRAVGVAGAGRGSTPRELLGYRLAVGWSFDRAALEAAVQRYAPRTVPVVDGPPLRRAGLADLATGYRAHRNDRRRRSARNER
jgi:hypothetical protein